MNRLTLTIEALEDLHIGTGTGFGDIDSLQARDRRGWPVIPASHIKGLLREAACEWRRLDQTALTREDIDTLFGRQGSGQGCLQLTSAYLPDESKYPLKTLLWGSTQISQQTGAAQDQSLRYIEYVPAGSQFKLHAYLSGKDDGRVELLKAIIARCSRLGGGRNRGHGQVRWSLDDPQSPNTVQLTKPKEQSPVRLRLLLRNLDPICLARTGHPGNLISSESFIRGRGLRGAFVAACLALDEPEWAQHLLSPKMSWGDALPLPVDNLTDDLKTADVLPIPLSIGTRKTKAPISDLPWWASTQPQIYLGDRDEVDQITLKDDKRPTEKLKRPTSGEFLFQAKRDARWQRYKPQLMERLHTRVPSEDNEHEQALFSTEEIAERTLFLADLLINDGEQVDTLDKVLRKLENHWLRIGRGGHPLVVVAAEWLPLPEHGNTPDAGFTLLLESDLIARDKAGNFHNRLSADMLVELAGLSDEIKPTQVKTEKTISEGIDLFGFNAATGLPRMAQHAIKAGSVVRVEGAEIKKLYQALSKRLVLGECPEEGFGRFRMSRLPQPISPQTAQADNKKGTKSPEELLCEKAHEWADNFGKKLFAPSPSQWGDFRGRLQAARTHDEIKQVFNSIEAAAKKQGGRAWEGFVDHPKFHPFRDALSAMSDRDALELLEYFTRWQRAMKKASEKSAKEHRS